MKKIFSLVVFVFIIYHVVSQPRYELDRVYTGNQVSNTVSVINPANNQLLGEIVLGKPQTNVLSALYKGQALVHGLGYSHIKKMLAVVAIGSNSVSLISTIDNTLLKTIYIGRSPHEATFKPDGSQVWVTVRGESHLSVIDVHSMQEVQKVSVSDGPGMVAFTPDNAYAYVCSSFSPVVEVIETATYKLVKKIQMPSPFSPNIFMSPDGNLVALTLKDIGKVIVIDTRKNEIIKEFATGPITNHVTFSLLQNRLVMSVTVGGENRVKLYDVASDYKQIASIQVGNLPHGLWPSADGKRMYVGLEYADAVQAIDMDKLKVIATIKIGQSPQALLYAQGAQAAAINFQNGLSPLQDTGYTQVVTMTSILPGNNAVGELAVRPIGLTDLVEQLFLRLKPNTGYSLVLSKSTSVPYNADYEINAFITDATGKYAGQSTGLIKSRIASPSATYETIVLLETASMQSVMVNKPL